MMSWTANEGIGYWESVAPLETLRLGSMYTWKKMAEIISILPAISNLPFCDFQLHS